MAMATQTSLFIPAILFAPKFGDQVTMPWKKSSFVKLPSFKSKKFVAPRTIKVGAVKDKVETATKEAPIGFTPLELDPSSPSPIFGGSIGGLLHKAQVKEFYVITWDSPKEQIVEMPIGGATIMR
ncbi:hypothetical protein CRYUN_Cryun40dG0047000 [Craigia yunnanensis]